MKRNYFILILFGSFAFPDLSEAKINFIEKNIHQKKMLIEVASTPEDLIQGLSDRQTMLENQAMLFVFPQEKKLHFWMYHMHFDLDMFWLDKNCRVVDIFSDQKPCQKNDVCPIVSSPHSAKYVLETNI